MVKNIKIEDNICKVENTGNEGNLKVENTGNEGNKVEIIVNEANDLNEHRKEVTHSHM